jgi:hypothetical protein
MAFVGLGASQRLADVSIEVRGGERQVNQRIRLGKSSFGGLILPISGTPPFKGRGMEPTVVRSPWTGNRSSAVRRLIAPVAAYSPQEGTGLS